jgi:uncharacterized membrane protein
VWLEIALRWIHVFAAILWIGHTYLFNFMEKSLEHEASLPEHVRGRLWMVHGGGFYFVEKQKKLVGSPKILHWFKWESAVTWLSGTLLLLWAYYHGGLLVEPEQSFTAGCIAGIATLVLGWVAYDMLVTSALGRHEAVLAAMGWLSFMAITWALRAFLSPRAVLIHLGGMIGTIMAANVWMRILPSQRKMIAAIEAGKTPEVQTAATGPLRSKQNSYLVIPLTFLMISNHYTGVYSSDHAWAIVGGAFLAGWGVARLFRGATKPGEGAPALAAQPWWKAAVGLGVLAGALGAAVKLGPPKEARADTPVTTKKPPPRPVTDEPAPTGEAVAAGVVRFAGAVPAPEPWGGAANGDCRGLHPDEQQVVKVKDGKLADVFVYVSDGLPAGSFPVPTATVRFDQKGCEFEPRVFGVVAGQPIAIGNSDRFVHNVRSPSYNQAFNAGSTREMSMEEPAVMTTVKCDMHPWMRAYVGVLEHPYFAVSAADGSFEIRGLVDGDYTLSAWHEKLGPKEQKIHVEAAKPASVEIAYP